MRISSKSIGRTALRVYSAAIAFLILGNLSILGVTVWARLATSDTTMPAIAGIRHLQVVDTRVWRGSAPIREALRVLADRGVTTVVDLRTETRDERDYLASLGVRLVRLPIRDGQTPTPAQVEQLVEIVRHDDGIVFVHCGAGVGRTGAMAAAYLVATRQASAGEAARRSLAVGPPSLEQIAFMATLEASEHEPVNGPVMAVSRFLDAPRRIFSDTPHISPLRVAADLISSFELVPS